MFQINNVGNEQAYVEVKNDSAFDKSSNYFKNMEYSSAKNYSLKIEKSLLILFLSWNIKNITKKRLFISTKLIVNSLFVFY